MPGRALMPNGANRLRRQFRQAPTQTNQNVATLDGHGMELINGVPRDIENRRRQSVRIRRNVRNERTLRSLQRQYHLFYRMLYLDNPELAEDEPEIEQEIVIPMRLQSRYRLLITFSVGFATAFLLIILLFVWI